jgi:FkbM family methyltransferase
MPCPGEQYFPGLFFLNAEECFVDCGAYTGDTIESFARQAVDGFRKVIAFEADPAVLSGLRSFMQALGSRALLHESAVAARTGVVHFSGDGIGGGRVTVNSSAEVPCVSLDDALVHEPVTMIKMDIEGSELKALEGAHRVIWRDRPVLAICGYHRPDHLWRVLASLKTLAPDWALFLRSHCADGLDTVCYAVPPERQISAATDTRHRSPIHRRVLARSSAS